MVLSTILHIFVWSMFACLACLATNTTTIEPFIRKLSLTASTEPTLHELLNATAVPLPETEQAQTLPLNPCPEYFQYLRSGNKYIGKITLSDVPFGPLALEATFWQNQITQSPFRTRLSFDRDLEQVQTDMELGQPIVFRVDYPAATEIPRLLSVAVNNVQKCKANLTEISGAAYTLRRNFTPTPGTHRRKPKYLSPNPAVVQLESRNGAVQWEAIDAICGEHSDGTNSLIRGGKNLNRGQFPWLAVIFRKQQGGLLFFYGGTLISPRSVVTSARGFNGNGPTAQQLIVLLGRHDLDDFEEEGFETHDVENIVIHPDYKFPETDFSSDADIALLQLKIAVSVTEYMRPVCLWQDSERLESVVGKTGYIGAWDIYEDVMDTPKVIETKIISKHDCYYTFELYKSLTSQRSLCAKNVQTAGKCSAGAGSAVLFKRKGLWTLRGLITSGQITNHKCSRYGHVIYNDVGKHIPWMRSNALF